VIEEIAQELVIILNYCIKCIYFAQIYLGIH